MRRPIPRADLTFEGLGPASVLLRSEVEAHWLDGSAYPLVIPLLDGRTTDDVVAALDGALDPETVHYVLAVLERRGLIQDHDPLTHPFRAAFWRRAGADPLAAAARLTATPIEIRCVADDDAIVETLAGAVGEWGVRVEAGGSLLVLLTHDYCDPALAGINRECLNTGRRWILVNPWSRLPLAGPVFGAGASPACWACLEHRLQENRLTAPIADRDSPFRPFALQFAVHELIKWIGLSGSPLDGGIIAFDPATLVSRRHVVHRRPQCHACGDPATATAFGPVVLQSQQKTYRADGGYRTRAPEETAAMLAQHLSPLTGIAPELWCSHGEGSTIYSTRINGPLGSVFHREALAGRPLAAAGKGMSPAQSRAGCLAEAVERYSACFQGSEPHTTASAVDLGPAAVEPGRLLCFSDTQYRTRDDWNRRHDRQYEIPEPCAPDTVLDWIPSWSISANEPRFLPAAYCFIDYSSRYCAGDSNGCAAGNTIEEAILQGFLELVERDALAIWWRNRLLRPARDIGSFDHPSLAASALHTRALGRTLQVFDLTHDLEIPVFAAVSATLAGDGIRIGSGAHLDPHLALTRAVAEVHQSLTWPRERATPGLTLDTAPHLRPNREWQDHPPAPSSTDLRDDVLRCVELARRRGLEVIVTNLTRPDVGFPVVRVTVPGLRHYRPRFGPGRLYQVPVEMGWLAHPLAEADILLEPLVL